LNPDHFLPIALCHTLQLILLLDSIRVAASLCRVDKFFSQALSDALDITERCLTGTNSEESDSLVYSAQRRDIDSLATNGTSRSDTCAILTRAAVHDGVDSDLNGVLVGHDVNLNSVNNRDYAMSSNHKFTYNLKSVCNNANGHELLSVVATIHHEGVGKTLDDRALSLAKSFHGISASGVRNVNWCADLDIIATENY
jgi:hypothetical protein